jgi:hypothetical protein
MIMAPPPPPLAGVALLCVCAVGLPAAATPLWAAATSSQCKDALDRLCPRSSAALCDLCVGNHQAALRHTGCSGAQVRGWCAGLAPAPASCQLTTHTSGIRATADGQVIEVGYLLLCADFARITSVCLRAYLRVPTVEGSPLKSALDVLQHVRVVVTEGAAITVSGFKRVTIRNVEVSFGPQARGIQFGAGADGITIINASLRLAHAPSQRGALPSAGAVAIGGSSSGGVRIDRVRAEGMSSGVYLQGCHGAHLSNIEGHNMRGPFPRGQCVQFDKCNSSLLEDFSCENDNTSYTEDNINVFESNNVCFPSLVTHHPSTVQWWLDKRSATCALPMNAR